MPKPKYDHPVIQKGAVQVFAHLAQKPMSADLRKVRDNNSYPVVGNAIGVASNTDRPVLNLCSARVSLVLFAGLLFTVLPYFGTRVESGHDILLPVCLF